MAGGSGVFKSDDGGDSWAQLSGLPPQGFSVVAASSADPNIVYAGSDASPPPPGTTPGPGTTGGGVWRSADRGGTWTPLASGLDEHQITALGVARNSPTSVYAAAYNSDKKTVTPYELTDVLAPPAGQPEGGFCPEGPCQGVTALASPSPGALSPSPEGSPCASHATAPAPTPRGTSPLATASPRPGRPSGAVASPPARTSITQPSGALASASPSSLIPTAAPTPCQSGGITLPLGPRHDLPLGLGAGVLGLLLVLLAARLVITRR